MRHSFDSRQSGMLKLSKTSRIIICFSLGIILPSLMLGYLALRGIRNDRALMEKERLDRCTRIAAGVEQALEEQYRVLCNELRQLTETIPSNSSHIPALCCSLRTRYPLVETVFTVTPSGNIRFPGQRLLYSRDFSSPHLTVSAGVSSSIFQRGEQDEFIHLQYKKAAACYIQAYEEAATAEDRALILCALARVREKSKQWQEAIAVYRQMISRCGSVILDPGMPAHVVARLEMGSIYRETADYTRAGHEYMGLYQRLLRGDIEIQQNTFEWLRRECINRLTSLAEYDRTLASVLQDSMNIWETREAVMEEQCQRYLAFGEQAGIYLARGTSGLSERQETDKKIVLESLGGNPEICLLKSVPARGNVRWGMLLNQSYMLSDLLPTVLTSAIGTESIKWLLRDESGVPLTPEGTPASELVLQTAFKDRFPPWTLEFRESDRPWYDTLFLSRHSIYVYMFILIGCVLLFGLYLTYRTIYREMELTRIKTDFVTAVSHDFKNPLTSIRQLSEMLQAGRVPSESRRNQYYQVLVEQSDRLKFMVNNILDYTKMEKSSKTFHFEMVNLAPVIAAVVSDTQSRLLSSSCMIHADISTDLPLIRGDAAALEQALYNLVDNAVKFAGDSCRVEIRVHSVDGNVILSVQDWGIGIAAEEQEKIFREFYRAHDSKARGIKGSGLGLTLVSQIVRAHGGEIGLESTPGQGSTFTITIPIH